MKIWCVLTFLILQIPVEYGICQPHSRELYVRKLIGIGSNLVLCTDDRLFVSGDQGANWKDVSSQLKCNSISDLFKFRSNVYVGSSKGIFVSSDSGKSWNALGNESEDGLSYVSTIAVDDGILLAGAIDRGLSKSTDNGVTWLRINKGLPSIYEFMATACTVHKSSMYVAIKGTSNNSNIYRSTNNGKEWSEFSEGISRNMFFEGYTFSESNGNLMIGTSEGVFLLSDNKRWIPADVGLPEAAVFSLCVHDSCLFAATSKGVFMSTNNGTLWQTCSNGISKRYTLSLTAISTNIFAGTTRGLFASTNSGKLWARKEIRLADPEGSFSERVQQSSISSRENIMVALVKAVISGDALSVSTYLTSDPSLISLDPAPIIGKAFSKSSSKSGTKKNSLLNLACAFGHTEVARILLKNGLSPTKRTPGGEMALLNAVAMHDQPDLIQLLVDHGANVNFKDAEDGETTMHTAASANYLLSLRILLALGANPSIKDRKGRTPSDIALEFNHPDAAALIRASQR